jgi:hypothetical protein
MSSPSNSFHFPWGVLDRLVSVPNIGSSATSKRGSLAQDFFIGICPEQEPEVVEMWSTEKRSLEEWAPRWRSPDPGQRRTGPLSQESPESLAPHSHLAMQSCEFELTEEITEYSGRCAPEHDRAKRWQEPYGDHAHACCRTHAARALV